MISYVAEVWLALFAAFAVGSLLGWLIYRWVDRSNYAFDQSEFTDSAGRPPARANGRQRMPARPIKPTAASGKTGIEATSRRSVARASTTSANAPSPPRIRQQFRSKVADDNVGSAKQETRNQMAPAMERTQARPVQLPQPQTRVAALLRARGAKSADATAITERPSGSVERPETGSLRPPGPGATSGGHDEPWPAKVEAWPIERPTPTSIVKSQSGRAGAPVAPVGDAVVLTQRPSDDEIWSAADATTGDKADTVSEPISPDLVEGEATGPAKLDGETEYEAAPIAYQKEGTFTESRSEASSGPRMEEPDVTGSAHQLADSTQPPSLASPPSRRDNLKKVKGIGPGFKKRLNELGIFQFAQIAEWSAAEQIWIGQALGFEGRIERDDWVKQAVALRDRPARSS